MIGKKIIELDRVDSTNAYANQVFTASASYDGVVIWAHEQYAGHGQNDHVWTSEAGKNLTFTVCLKPRFLAPDRQFQLNKAIVLAILDFIRSFHDPVSGLPFPEAFVKWPNDIYVGRQKIGGILIENKIMGSTLETSLVGIGVNINQTRFAAEIPNPISLIHLLQHEILLKDALLSLCRFLDKRYNELRQVDPLRHDQEFNQNILGAGQWRTFLSNGVQMEGRIHGVDCHGRLMVEARTGELHCFGHREIEYML